MFNEREKWEKEWLMMKQNVCRKKGGNANVVFLSIIPTWYEHEVLKKIGNTPVPQKTLYLYLTYINTAWAPNPGWSGKFQTFLPYFE